MIEGMIISLPNHTIWQTDSPINPPSMHVAPPFETLIILTQRISLFCSTLLAGKIFKGLDTKKHNLVFDNFQSPSKLPVFGSLM